MRNERYEEYLIDSIWKTRDDISDYKIVAIPLKDDIVYYTFSGLLINSKILKPNDKKCTDEEPTILFSSKNYDLVKYLFIKMIQSNNISSENTSTLETFDELKNIYGEIA